MKKSIKIIFSLLLCLVMLTGCTSTGNLLDDSGNEFSDGLSVYELENEGKIPKSVLDTLDFMLENYTGGLTQPKPEDIENNEVDDEDEKKELDGDAKENAQTRDELKKLLLKTLTNTERSVTLRIKKDLYSMDLLVELIFEEICPEYIIEALGVNSFSSSYYFDVLTNEYVVEIEFLYFELDNYNHKFTLDEIKQMKEELKKEAERVVKTLNLNALSEYERVKAVNKYLCDLITYSAGDGPYMPIQHTPYGALINGDCVCEGYAKSAKLLFDMCGIEAYYVTGDTSGGPHGWNLVKVEGKYYQLDITWNDADSYPNQYFLVTDDYMSLSRIWDKAKYPASADRAYS